MGLFKRKPKRPKVDLLALQRDLEILNDCAKLIENTTNPDTFFSRYDLYMQKLMILANAESSGLVNVSGDSFLAKLNVMNSESQKIETINSFIDRMWEDTCIKADKLKTDTGKQNRYKQYTQKLQKYEYCMPPQCVIHYKAISNNGIGIVDRYSIKNSKIDELQRLPASPDYCHLVYQLYYQDYPIKPFISKDRELNTNWLQQAESFSEQSIVSKSMLTRYEDGLLPGHIYMLYWLGKYTNKKIPAYFEYKYGIDFCKEEQFLTENGYLADRKPTEKGKQSLAIHYDVVNK